MPRIDRGAQPSEHEVMAGDAGVAYEAEDDSRPLRAQVVADIVLVIVSIVAWLELGANEYIDFGQTEEDPGSGFIPRIALLLMGGGAMLHGVTLVVQAMHGDGFRSDGAFQRQLVAVPFLLMVSMLIYYLLLPVLGFLITSVILGAIWVPIFHWRSGAVFRKRHILYFAIEVMLIPSVIFVLFRYLILVPIP